VAILSAPQTQLNRVSPVRENHSPIGGLGKIDVASQQIFDLIKRIDEIDKNPNDPFRAVKKKPLAAVLKAADAAAASGPAPTPTPVKLANQGPNLHEIENRTPIEISGSSLKFTLGLVRMLGKGIKGIPELAGKAAKEQTLLGQGVA